MDASIRFDKERASTNYGKNEDGKWVRKRHFRECDYTVEGHLLEFDSQEAFLNFEEDRHQQGGGHLTVREEAEVDCTSSGLADPLFLLALPVK